MLDGGYMIIGFDLDGTLLPFVFPELADPYEWVKPTFKKLHEKGHKIWVYSARFNYEMYPDAYPQFVKVKQWLIDQDLAQYVKLSPFKPPADIIFDDAAVTLDGAHPENVKRMKELLEIND